MRWLLKKTVESNCFHIQGRNLPAQMCKKLQLQFLQMADSRQIETHYVQGWTGRMAGIQTETPGKGSEMEGNLFLSGHCVVTFHNPSLKTPGTSIGVTLVTAHNNPLSCFRNIADTQMNKETQVVVRSGKRYTFPSCSDQCLSCQRCLKSIF